MNENEIKLERKELKAELTKIRNKRDLTESEITYELCTTKIKNIMDRQDELRRELNK